MNHIQFILTTHRVRSTYLYVDPKIFLVSVIISNNDYDRFLFKESALIDVYLADEHSMRSPKRIFTKNDRLEKVYRILCEHEKKKFVNDNYPTSK